MLLHVAAASSAAFQPPCPSDNIIGMHYAVTWSNSFGILTTQQKIRIAKLDKILATQSVVPQRVNQVYALLPRL